MQEDKKEMKIQPSKNENELKEELKKDESKKEQPKKEKTLEEIIKEEGGDYISTGQGINQGPHPNKKSKNYKK